MKKKLYKSFCISIISFKDRVSQYTIRRIKIPTYDVRNKDTGEEKEVILSYDALQVFIKDGTWSQIHKSGASTISYRDTVMCSQTSGDWRDLVKKIKKGSGRDNTIKV